MSFPRKRESRATATSLALDPRFRGGDSPREMRKQQAFDLILAPMRVRVRALYSVLKREQRKKRPGWQRRAIRASRAKGGSFRAELGQIEFRGRAGRRRRLQVAAARPVETGGAPRSRAGVGVGSPLSDVSSDHWRTPCLTCRPTVGHRPLVAVAGTAGRAGSNAHPASSNTSPVPILLRRTRAPY